MQSRWLVAALDSICCSSHQAVYNIHQSQYVAVCMQPEGRSSGQKKMSKNHVAVSIHIGTVMTECYYCSKRIRGTV